MRRLQTIITMCFMFVCFNTMQAQKQQYYGYAPFTPDTAETTAHGSGKNNYTEALICLDPAVDPLMRRLKGSKVVGVRCFLRTDYHQESKGYSSIMLYKESLAATPTKKVTNFNFGWNEVLFDEPVDIDDNKLYVGMQVFETKGDPYPFVAFEPISVPNSFFINIGRQGWTEYNDRGTLLVQAIISTDSELFENVAYVNATDFPLVVAPGKEFSCRMYIHNLSDHAISSIEVESIAGENGTPRRQSFTLEPPLAAYDGKMIPAVFTSSNTVGVAEPMLLSVAKVNGKEAPATLEGSFSMYVSEDVFTRIPLIEEFTGQTCVNCPLMSYYLDIALEEYAAPYVYIAHHAGYANDTFTTEADKQILYLFGSDVTYNPAIMYDRTVLKGELLPVNGIRALSHEPYLAAINEVITYPAQAQVLVDLIQEDGKASCRVHGKISKSMMQTGADFYLSTYLIEDSIPEEKYPQAGLDVQDAPADLADRFAHNGVIRHNFCQDPIGDKLILDEDAGFSVDYPQQTISPDWNWNNCQVVAFVHKIDRENLRENYVLNAGSNRLNGVASGICPTMKQQDGICVYVDLNRRITTSEPVKELFIYNLQGQMLDRSAILNPGFYVVRYTARSGCHQTKKILVR